MKRTHWIVFCLAMVGVWAGLAWGQDAAVSSGVTPESIKGYFDANRTMFKFGVGILVKYLPFLAKVANASIGWIGVLLGILIDLFTPGQARAAGAGEMLGFAGSIFFQNFVQQVWARQLYEGLARPLLEKLGAKKAVPR